MKYLFVFLLLFSLTGCFAKRAAEAEENYTLSYGGYLASQSDCMSENKNKVEVPQIQGDPIKIEFAAGGCDDIKKPQHGGEYVAKSEAALLQMTGTIVGAIVQGGFSYANSKDNNDTRVELSEIQNEVLVTAIESSGESAQAAAATAVSVAEQSARVTELVISLTEQLLDDEDDLDEPFE